MLSVAQCARLLLVLALGADDVLPSPTLKATPDPIPVRKTRHYVVQIRLIEVDEQGRETVLGEPKLQTTGGNAGISIDHADGRRFEFSMRLTDRLAPGDELIPAKTTATTQVESALKKLEQRIDLNVQQRARKEVLREVSKRAGVSIAIDPESVRSIVAEMDAPVDLIARDEPVSAILDRLIAPLKLGYAIKHDVVLIAAEEKLLPAPEDFIVRTYNVADLVGRRTDRDAADFAPLIDRIKSNVLPTSWERKEAAASIRPFDSTLSIAVRQTAAGHASIERLLERIRKEQPKTLPE